MMTSLRATTSGQSLTSLQITEGIASAGFKYFSMILRCSSHSSEFISTPTIEEKEGDDEEEEEEKREAPRRKGPNRDPTSRKRSEDVGRDRCCGRKVGINYAVVMMMMMITMMWCKGNDDDDDNDDVMMMWCKGNDDDDDDDDCCKG